MTCFFNCICKFFIFHYFYFTLLFGLVPDARTSLHQITSVTHLASHTASATILLMEVRHQRYCLKSVVDILGSPPLLPSSLTPFPGENMRRKEHTYHLLFLNILNLLPALCKIRMLNRNISFWPLEKQLGRGICIYLMVPHQGQSVESNTRTGEQHQMLWVVWQQK